MYEPTDWQSGEAGGTLVTAPRLRNIEQALVDGDLTNPDSVASKAMSAAFVPRGQTMIGLDTDGVPYFSDTLAFADAVPIRLDTDGVPYLAA